MADTEKLDTAIAESLYPEASSNEFWEIYNYDPIIKHFGTVVVQVADVGYQGDTRVLYADTGKGVGYLNIGWGSCCGCDALQACRGYLDLAELINKLEAGIKWMPNEEMLKFFKEHDWLGDYYGLEKEQMQFVQAAIEYMETGKKQEGLK